MISHCPPCFSTIQLWLKNQEHKHRWQETKQYPGFKSQSLVDRVANRHRTSAQVLQPIYREIGRERGQLFLQRCQESRGNKVRTQPHTHTHTHAIQIVKSTEGHWPFSLDFSTLFLEGCREKEETRSVKKSRVASQDHQICCDMAFMVEKSESSWSLLSEEQLSVMSLGVLLATF